jgi:hypothetical protein
LSHRRRQNDPSSRFRGDFTTATRWHLPDLLPSRGWTWSTGLLEILGLAESEPPTQDLLLERQHPHDRAAVQDFIDEVASAGEPTAAWHRVVGPDRTVRRVLTARPASEPPTAPSRR